MGSKKEEGANTWDLQLSRPLELKVQTVFGQVIGGTLNTHSQLLWVARDGGVQLWDDAARSVWTRQKRLCRQEASLPAGVLETLQRELHDNWIHIRTSSEQSSRAAGLDE